MTTQSRKTTKRSTKTESKSTRRAAKGDRKPVQASANTCEDTAASGGLEDCGCGSSGVRVWTTSYDCCGQPLVVARSFWDDCCCSC